MADATFCRHFPPGGILNTHCVVGVEIMSVKDTTAPRLRLPCCDPEAARLCSRRAPYTEAEIAETSAVIAAFLRKLGAFSSGTDRTCPACGAAVDGIDLYEKSEPQTYSLYTRPCGCRHGLWSSAPQWAKERGIVRVIHLTDEEQP